MKKNRKTNGVGTWGGVLCFIQMVPMIGSVLLTERALKQKFDDNGNAR
ncbi:MAG: hypothetical protein ACOCM4_06945 [Acetivibrio ethanolgignens]